MGRGVSGGGAAAEYIFLDPMCVVQCIRCILDQRLVDQILTFDRLNLDPDAQSDWAHQQLRMAQKSAQRGIIQWRFIRDYLRDEFDMTPEVVEVVRMVLESFNVIVHIRTNGNTHTMPILIPPTPFVPIRTSSVPVTPSNAVIARESKDLFPEGGQGQGQVG
mmetsp:Transcript_21421/g.47573  ORF Transcript_21421/g.47573 Transcript_21421/m.47573 type:complete len:162 (+) Transcript_21421:2-487(+)